jgi:hypothetical protein
MSDTTTAAAEAQEIALSTRALKAFGEAPGLRCGALSPLARISPPDAPSDRAGLLNALTALEGPWVWAAPALLDPHLSVAVLFGDGDSSLVGQYLWPDADARGPGFRAVAGKDDVRLAGPLSDGQVLLSCLDMVSLSGVAEPGPLKMKFSLDQFWATLALLDAYRIALLRRRLSRQGAYPAGVSAAGLAEAWKAGLATVDPGWSVSLFALLRPDLVPSGFDTRVAAVVDAMDGAGLLAKLAGDPGDPLGDVYILGEGLDLLCKAVLAGIVHIGLAVSRLRAENEVETTAIGGWRTGGGFWLADLSTIPLGGTGSVDVRLLGPGYFAGLIEGALGGAGRGSDDGPAAAPFDMATPYSRDALVDALRPAPTVTGADAAATPATGGATAATPEPAAAGSTPVATPATAPTGMPPAGTPAAGPAAGPGAPAPAVASPGWAPTHTIPAGGMVAWVAPDPRSPNVALAVGLPVAVVERRGGWARVVASNGWSGWVDGSRLP